jgi:uncharacterized protein YsxB (DUF464 family)
MTEIRLLYTASILQGYQVSGHAGAGTEGNDLVCAAVSFLAITCANALETVAGARPQVNQGKGYLEVLLSEGNVPHDAIVILETFRQGARDLEDAYPRNIRLYEQAP